MTFAVVIEPLSPAHDRAVFSCGVAALDRYIREQASQDVRRRMGNCFVAIEQETYAIAGYYTLAASSVHVSELPAAETRRLPRYPAVPATLIGRLAVDNRYRGTPTWDDLGRRCRTPHCAIRSCRVHIACGS